MRLPRTSALWLDLLPYVLVAGFILVVLLFYPFRFVFEIDPDEGIQVMKAFLFSRGHGLYSEIYSDQPPLLTLILSVLFKVLGPKVLPARLAVLAFSALLMTSAVVYLHVFWSRLHAILGLLLLVLLPSYAQLSVSVMVGLPAIALAMASLLFLCLWQRGERVAWLVLSACLLSASIMVKLFTVILLPIIVAGLLLAPGRQALQGPGKWGRIRPALVWSATFGLVLGAVLLGLVGPTNVPQLFETHLGVRGIEYFERETLVRHGRDLWPLFLLATLGSGWVILKRAWTGTCFLAWMVVGAAFLTVNTPVWYHQVILIACPACVLGAIGVAEPLAGKTWGGWGRLCQAALAIAAGVLLVVYALWAIPRVVGKMDSRLPNLVAGEALRAREYDLLTLIDYFDPGGKVLVTDRPMFAFRSRRETPPELANLSQKVMRGGIVSEQRIIDLIHATAPPIVLLARFDLPEVESYLDSRYDQVYGYVDLRLFVKP